MAKATWEQLVELELIVPSGGEGLQKICRVDVALEEIAPSVPGLGSGLRNGVKRCKIIFVFLSFSLLIPYIISVLSIFSTYTRLARLYFFALFFCLLFFTLAPQISPCLTTLLTKLTIGRENPSVQVQTTIFARFFSAKAIPKLVYEQIASSAPDFSMNLASLEADQLLRI